MSVAAAASAAAAGGLHLLGLSPWASDPRATVVVFALMVGAVAVCTLFDPPRPDADAGGTFRLSFVAVFAALLLGGAHAMTLVAVLAVAARAIIDPPRTHLLRRVPLELVTAAAAAQAAGVTYAVAGGMPVPLSWPQAALPGGAATVVWSLLLTSSADWLLPLVTGGARPRAWHREALRGVPVHVAGAAGAALLLQLIDARAWTLLLVAGVPLYCAWHVYSTHAGRLVRHDRRLKAISSQDHGICVVDDEGRVTRWNETLSSFVECEADRAVGRSLADALPALALSDLPGAVRETLTTGTPRTLPQLRVRSGAITRVFSVTVLPDAGGAMLVWLDVSEQARSEQTLRDTAERFALIAEGANDGVWELDEQNRTLFVSRRWREMLGLSEDDSRMALEEWFDRIHPDDLRGLHAALEKLRSGEAERVEYRCRIRHEDGSYRRVLCRCVAAKSATGRVRRIAGSLTNVTETVAAQEKAATAGWSDPLTGLPNRAAFVDRLGRRLADFRERRSGRFGMLHLNLDRFKVVNESLGHLVGDELLVAVARRLERCLRPGDALARLGGDEFAVLLDQLLDEGQANVAAFRVHEALTTPVPVGGREVTTSASIGIVVSRAEHTGPDAMMRDAEAAMFHAKSHGKARHELFDAHVHARAQDRLGLESDLRHAVKNAEFEVHYQPIVSLESRMCVGFESLVRWNRNGKPVSPADFVPMAEELGIIEPLGAWVMQQACQKFAEWKTRYPGQLEYITVNVSARQLVQQGFVYLVEQTIDRNRLAPADLRLEITETALMDAPQSAAKALDELRAFGVKIYLDDFGTGFSSLSHLHKLPVDALKIDQSFVRGLFVQDRPAMVESILALARTLQTGVVAEGVEDERQASTLEQLGCRHAQGYYFSRPIPAPKADALLAAHAPLGGVRQPASPQTTVAFPARTLKSA